MRQQCQDVCLIWTHCNQQCNQEHWYTYIHTIGISPWTNMPVTLNIAVLLCCYSRLHVAPDYLTYELKQVSQQALSSAVCNMHMCYAFGNHIYSFSFMTTYVFLVWQTYIFFLISTKIFWWPHVYIYTNTNTHEVLKDSLKYFIFVRHICSFTSIIPYVFLVWVIFLFFFFCKSLWYFYCTS